VSDIEITYFRSRIDDVLQSGRPTTWQRGFLVDMREKIERYGTRTRFSEKQLSTLKRLTAIKGDADLRLVVSNTSERTSYRRPGNWGLSYREQKFLIMAAVMVVVLISSIARQIADNASFNFPSASVSSPS